MHKFLAASSAIAILTAAPPALAQEARGGDASVVAEETGSTWVTLGTSAGPVPSPTRSQPANLLIANGKNILVDVGDGAAGQLSHVGIATKDLDALFISHLHWDHTGGLAAVLGLRVQTNASAPLVIYGPPGTQEMVDGLLASMVPGNISGYGVPGASRPDLTGISEVVELRDHDRIEYAGMTVTARKNTHYSFLPGSDLDQLFEALSFRFDLPERSIVYTGDTGPSEAVVELAQEADLLVAEMMDVELTVSMVRDNSPNTPERVLQGIETHLRDHHLLPRDVGELARDAGVSAVVVTHFSGDERPETGHFEYLREIAETYDGPVVIANDMDAF